jgi:F0F1-type ATP synthase assembly protein I
VSKPNPKLKSKKEPRQIEEAPAESQAVRTETQEKKTLVKEKTPAEKQKEYKEGIIKTVVATALGIIAGFLANTTYGTGETKAWYLILFIVIGITYFVQKYLIFPSIKIDAKEFKLKDWFYVEFIIIDFFLVTWTLLLN